MGRRPSATALAEDCLTQPGGKRGSNLAAVRTRETVGGLPRGDNERDDVGSPEGHRGGPSKVQKVFNHCAWNLGWKLGVPA